ncbi:hypothetical protein MKX01_034884 [Papaver californicum]|nr:hypothetical protein MKX01_034884 [Papaver californicum]
MSSIPEEEKNLDMLIRFPEDIYVDILSRIPVKSLLTCKCISKNWNAQISSSDFVRLHLNLTIQKNKPNLMLRQYSSNRETNINIIYSVANSSLASASWVIDYYDHAVEMDYPFKSLGYTVELIVIHENT